MAYITYSDVAAALPRYNLTTTTKPSQTDVTGYITRIEARANGTLRSVGIETPVTDATALEYVKDWVLNGACWYYLRAKLADLNQNTEEADQYKEDFLYIEKHILKNPDLLKTSDKIASEYSADGLSPFTDTIDFDDNEREPLFDDIHDMANGTLT
jgi:hypothetical protein